MKRFIEGVERTQFSLLPEYLDDYISDDNSVRTVDAFVQELDPKALGFEGADPAITLGRPLYHPAVLLKIYLRVRRPHTVESAARARGLNATAS